MTANAKPAPIRINGYSHITRLTSGGSSALFSAVRNSVGDRVAIKLISSSFATPEAMLVFNRERNALQALRDESGIVALFDSGTTDRGEPYLVMPLLDRSLQDVLVNRGPLSWPRMALVMSGIADAVARAHSVGVLHRDIKPGNILLTQEGAPYLADFGIARMTNNTTMTIKGVSATLDYAPPEILDYQEPSAASDVFSLGMTCFASLIGCAPLRPDPTTTNDVVLQRIAVGPLPDPSDFGLSGNWLPLLRQSISREPSLRPSAATMATALADLVPGPAARPPPRQAPLPAAPVPGINASGHHPPIYRARRLR